MAGTAATREGRFGIPVAAIVILVLVAAGGAGFWYLDRASRKARDPGPPLTPEAKAYVRYLQLSSVEMKATDTYLGQTVVEITGQITNNGERNVRLAEINCVFYDPWGQVVLRERVAIVGKRMGGLAPGERKDFRLAFDNLPESWNQAMPQLVVARIDLD